MKFRTILFLTAATAILAACEEPRPDDQADFAPPPVVEPEAPAAPDMGAPAAAPAVTDTPPPEALPPEPATSEESVQPESETLFY